MLHCVAGAVQQAWTRGIQQVRPYHGCQEYKLAGTPWWVLCPVITGSTVYCRWAEGETAVESRQLLAAILASLRTLGWQVAATLDISRQLDDKTVFIFRQSPGAATLQASIQH